MTTKKILNVEARKVQAGWHLIVTKAVEYFRTGEVSITWTQWQDEPDTWVMGDLEKRSMDSILKTWPTRAALRAAVNVFNALDGALWRLVGGLH